MISYFQFILRSVPVCLKIKVTVLVLSAEYLYVEIDYLIEMLTL